MPAERLQKGLSAASAACSPSRPHCR